MVLLYPLATEERCVTEIWLFRGPDPWDHHDGFKDEPVTDPRITIFSSLSNGAMNILYGYQHLLSFVQLFPWDKCLVWNCWVTCMYVLNVGMFREVALQKSWPKVTPSQQDGRAGSAHPSHSWCCQSLTIYPSEKWGQLLKSVPNPEPLFGSCSHMPVPIVTYPGFASKSLAWSFIQLYWSPCILFSLH